MNSPVKLKLPSGARIVARKPDSVQLAIWGQALRLVGVPLEADYTAWDDGHLLDTAAVLCGLLSHCYVEPQISLDRSSPGSIHPLDIPKKDWVFVVRLALGAEKAHTTKCRRKPSVRAGRRGRV